MKFLVVDSEEHCGFIFDCDGYFAEDLTDIENFIKKCRKDRMELAEIIDEVNEKYKVKGTYFDNMNNDYFDIADMEMEW